MDAPTDAELKTRFNQHVCQGDQAERYEGIRTAAFVFAQHICAATAPCREQSIALTKLEEVMFFANAAIARREVPQ